MDLKSYLRGLGLGMVVCACIIGLSNSRNKISDAEIKARAAKLGMVEEDKGVLTQLISDGSEATAANDSQSQELADIDIPEITIVPAGEDASGTKEIDGSKQTDASQDADKADDSNQNADANEFEAEAENSEAADTEEKSDKGVDSDQKADTSNEKTVKDDNPQTANEKADEQKNNSENKEKVKESKTIVVTVYPGEGSYTVSKKLANLGLVESADVFDRFLCQNGYDKRLSTGNYSIAVGSSAEKIAKLLTGG